MGDHIEESELSYKYLLDFKEGDVMSAKSIDKSKPNNITNNGTANSNDIISSVDSKNKSGGKKQNR